MRDLSPYHQCIQQYVNSIFINREGITMTMTSNETTKTTKTATLDTPSGTVLVLNRRPSTLMLAKDGALAVVDDNVSGGLPADRSEYLPVTWLKGHEGTNVHSGSNVMTQMDGSYYPEDFEVSEFQVGDRVRVTLSTHEFGYEGVIASIPAPNGDDCVVELDFPYENGLSYNFTHLKKVAIPDPLKEMQAALLRAFERATEAVEGQGDEPEDDCCASYYEDDEPLADWEKALLEDSDSEQEKGESLALDAGVVGVIEQDPNRCGFMEEWEGLRFPVKRASSWGDINLTDGVIDSRPDQWDGDFFWPEGEVRPFDPERDFRVGDLVESAHYAEAWGEPGKRYAGVVTRTDIKFGGDIEIDWTEGSDRLVTEGPLGAHRKYLTLVGVQKKEPVVISDFDFEAGQEIGSADVLDDLPGGTVLIETDRPWDPITKVWGGTFHSFYSDGDSFPEDVREMIEFGGTVLIVYVPAA